MSVEKSLGSEFEIFACIKYSVNAHKNTDFINGFSAFDRNIIAFAIKLKKIIKCKLTILCMASNSAIPFLQELFCLSVDRIILLSDTKYAGSDTLATSYILSQSIAKFRKKHNFVVLCGNNSLEGNTGLVGIEIAERLKVCLFDDIIDAEIQNDKIWLCKKNNRQLLNASCLCILRATHILPLPEISNIINCRFKKIEIWNNEEIYADETKIGVIGSKTRVISVNKLTQNKLQEKNGKEEEKCIEIN